MAVERAAILYRLNPFKPFSDISEQLELVPEKEMDNFSERGFLAFVNGDWYFGEFERGVCNGYGVLFWAKGDFGRELRWHPSQTEKYTGNWYTGYFRDGRIHGDGIYHFSQNITEYNRWEGNWESAKPVGSGILWHSEINWSREEFPLS